MSVDNIYWLRQNHHMGSNNSLVSEIMYLELFSNVVNDVADATHCPSSEVSLDLQRCRTRCTHEGLSFLTKNLALLGKALDKGLTDGVFTCPEGFNKAKGSAIPDLFRWHFANIFDATTGVPLNPDPIARSEEGGSVCALRQVLYYLYKLEIPHTQETETLCLDRFVECDAELTQFCINKGSEYIQDTARFINDVFWKFDPSAIVPKHGPGAVATGEKNHEKHSFRRIYRAIESVYPFTEYFEFSLSAVCDCWSRYEDLEILDSGTAKVVLVPKDSRGPRIISCEPLEYQWIQQGLGRSVMDWLERHRSTRGRVNFSSQQINRALALSASSDQEWVTLDMKEASDRVGCDLVKEVFQHNTALLAALLATRSTESLLPDGRKVVLEKFAPMGSCLCFPIQAVLFYALAVVAIRTVYGCSRREARESVYVFGDDIIVRKSYYNAVLQYLPTVGLVFNEAKCCTSGFFRESCGMDAYKGIDVTPLRLKKVWYHRRLDASTLEAYVDHGNMAYARGLRRVAATVARWVLEAGYDLPTLPLNWGSRGYLAWYRHGSVPHVGKLRTRYSNILHRWEIRAWASQPSLVKVGSDAWSMVLRRFTSPSDVHAPGVFAVTRGNCLHRVWTAL
jgi:hypothetical protein